eukprot:TRINITY_DN3158_c1_g1_i1.p1 TRINITY_DN3158_c1_g1~~TRINITY_DN3158_c1_g1_i1.p1  ORF type:complete len:716 (+),score=260.86 TRINITY_DN3158_c1_g1_i1:67-2148(+)
MGCALCSSGAGDDVADILKLDFGLHIEAQQGNGWRRRISNASSAAVGALRQFLSPHATIRVRQCFGGEKDQARLAKHCAFTAAELKVLWSLWVKTATAGKPSPAVFTAFVDEAELLLGLQVARPVVDYLSARLLEDEVLSFAPVVHLLGVVSRASLSEVLVFLFCLCDEDDNGVLTEPELRALVSVGCEPDGSGDGEMEEKRGRVMEQLSTMLGDNGAQITFSDFYANLDVVAKKLTGQSFSPRNKNKRRASSATGPSTQSGSFATELAESSNGGDLEVSPRPTTLGRNSRGSLASGDTFFQLDKQHTFIIDRQAKTSFRDRSVSIVHEDRDLFVVDPLYTLDDGDVDTTATMLAKMMPNLNALPLAQSTSSLGSCSLGTQHSPRALSVCSLSVDQAAIRAVPSWPWIEPQHDAGSRQPTPSSETFNIDEVVPVTPPPATRPTSPTAGAKKRRGYSFESFSDWTPNYVQEIPRAVRGIGVQSRASSVVSRSRGSLARGSVVRGSVARGSLFGSTRQLFSGRGSLCGRGSSRRSTVAKRMSVVSTSSVRKTTRSSLGVCLQRTATSQLMQSNSRRPRLQSLQSAVPNSQLGAPQQQGSSASLRLGVPEDLSRRKSKLQKTPARPRADKTPQDDALKELMDLAASSSKLHESDGESDPPAQENKICLSLPDASLQLPGSPPPLLEPPPILICDSG